MIRRLSVIALMFVMPLLAQASPVNLLEDGSFESYKVNANTWSTFYNVKGTNDGWRTGRYGVEIRNDVAGSAYDGENFAELDTSRNSWISQTINLNSNALLDLSFWYAPRSGVTLGSNMIAVFWNGHKLGVVSGNGRETSSWAEYSFEDLLGKVGTNTLKFVAVGRNDSYGGSLDNVSLVTSVPEPESYALMLVGLGFMATVVRRRKSKT